MRMFKEMFIANVKEYIRDKTALFWFIIFPLIFIFIFGWVFTGTQEQTFNVGIIAESENIMSEKMVEGFKSVESFNVSVEEEDTELKALKKGNRNIVVEIPDFDYQAVMQGESVDIPVYYDAGKQQTNQMLLSIVRQMFNEAERQMTGRQKIFTLAAEPFQSEGLTDFDYILPGILSMALMQLGLFGSLEFLSLREKKIVRGLGVTPLSRCTLLSSEILLRLILALVQTVLILSIGVIVFDVTIVGSLFQLLGIVILGSITFVSLGYLLISFVNSAEGGQGLIQVVQFPMMFLSGVFFPHELMPDFIQPIVRILPLTYLGDALRAVTTGAVSGYSILTNVLVLSGWLIVTFILAMFFWKWE
ncbi:MAG: ABC transporter permease [Halanaerobiales bacterium]